MKYYMDNYHVIHTCVFLVLCVLHETNTQMDTNLQLAAVGAFLLDILMDKKGGEFTILKAMNSLCHET